MSEKRPQPTTVLIKRLRRVAKALDVLATDHMASRAAKVSPRVPSYEQTKSYANTCWQAAGRLEDLARGVVN